MPSSAAAQAGLRNGRDGFGNVVWVIIIICGKRPLES